MEFVVTAWMELELEHLASDIDRIPQGQRVRNRSFESSIFLSLTMVERKTWQLQK